MFGGLCSSDLSSVNAAGVFSVPLSSVCVVKLRKTSPHHPISQPLLSSSPVFFSLKLLHQPFLWAFSASLHPISLRNLLFSLLQFPHPSICLPRILSISNPFSLSYPLPPPLLPWHHLRSISVFSPPSMWLQPFSHPTSNQTYSAYWWSSKGPQVDFYLSMHEASSLHLHFPTQHPLNSHPQPLSFLEEVFHLGVEHMALTLWPVFYHGSL